MILVVGAASRLGRVVTRLLLEAGHAVRATARRRDRLGELAALGAEWAELDLRRPEGFGPALDGVTRVLASAHGLTGRRGDSVDAIDLAGHRSLINAAQAAGIERFVYTSAHGARLDHPARFWAAKAAVEQHLKASGLSYSILRPAAFMDLHAFELIGTPMLAGKSVNVLGDGRFSRNLVAISDVAPIVLETLTNDGYRDTTIDVLGPREMSDMEIIAFYEQRLSRTGRIRFLPKAALGPLSRLMRPLHAGVANLMRLPLELPLAQSAEDTPLPIVVGDSGLDTDPRLRLKSC